MLYKNIFHVIKPVSLRCIVSHFLCYSTNQMSGEEHKLYIRREANSDLFQATFNWKCTSLNIDREFNFNRRLKEKLEDFLGRIKTNVEKVTFKKVKRKKNSPTESTFNGEICVKMFTEDVEVSQDEICGEVFFSNLYDVNNLILRVKDVNYCVTVNAPLIVKLAMPNSIMAGFPIYPLVEIKFGDKSNSKWTWFKFCNTRKEWIETSHNLLYIPSTEDIGKKLKVSCVPGNGQTVGPEMFAESNVTVEAGPGICPFDIRHAFTKETLPAPRFRVVSYNILADLYAETDLAKTELFPYCPSYALSLDYRKQLYLKEILGYNADIICLQEVDTKVFENELKDALGQMNFEGILTKKGASGEGVAMFYSTNKFKLIATKISELGDEIDINPIYKDIWDSVKINENLRVRFKGRNTVLQVNILESLHNPKQKIIVGNTHLYFRPDADHIRLLQAGMALVFLENTFKLLKSQNPQDEITMIICGDFNSTPDSGIYQLMTSNHVPKDVIYWKSKEGEEVEGLELRHNFSIASACGTPQYTNYTAEFSGCLDYIYYQTDMLNVTQVAPFPSEEELKSNIALPSITFPSDHVALVVDFEWKSRGNQ